MNHRELYALRDPAQRLLPHGSLFFLFFYFFQKIFFFLTGARLDGTEALPRTRISCRATMRNETKRNEGTWTRAEAS